MPPLGVALAPHVQGRSSAGPLAFLHPAGGGADNMWVATWSGLQMPNGPILCMDDVQKDVF